MMENIERKIAEWSSDGQVIDTLSKTEIDWMVETLKCQKEEIHHLRVLRTSSSYEERRESERVLHRIAQEKTRLNNGQEN